MSGRLVVGDRCLSPFVNPGARPQSSWVIHPPALPTQSKGMTRSLTHCVIPFQHITDMLLGALEMLGWKGHGEVIWSSPLHDLILKTANDRDSTTSLGSLFQYLTILRGLSPLLLVLLSLDMVELKKLENEEAERKRQHEKEEKQRQREEEEKKRQHEDRERERQHKERMHQRELEDKAKEREAQRQMHEREYEEQEKKRKHEEIIIQLQNRNLELRILRRTGLSASKNSPPYCLIQDALSSITHPTMPDADENGDDSGDDDDIYNYGSPH
ncbi:uncharacterized protein LOC116831276 isoform X2 [Chelonoidis abingdonii]|uniref:uncharacterized protein LOC116831276 isoform X2 n=1 Tax=Chelonoidis abingdonii TaxID=106734 RepID=UPI003F4991A9